MDQCSIEELEEKIAEGLQAINDLIIWAKYRSDCAKYLFEELDSSVV